MNSIKARYEAHRAADEDNKKRKRELDEELIKVAEARAKIDAEEAAWQEYMSNIDEFNRSRQAQQQLIEKMAANVEKNKVGPSSTFPL